MKKSGRIQEPIRLEKHRMKLDSLKMFIPIESQIETTKRQKEETTPQKSVQDKITTVSQLFYITLFYITLLGFLNIPT